MGARRDCATTSITFALWVFFESKTRARSLAKALPYRVQDFSLDDDLSTRSLKILTRHHLSHPLTCCRVMHSGPQSTRLTWGWDAGRPHPCQGHHT
ncbi:hypothetical protein AVEN_11183-1 [Araneus ventricosus]|uniref:Uncharacterized protein n=1 Tax=Araneus ventricosus TaxID=182803 RepID=A0A4Y2TEP0_ARAVE|nr:hypothetical protein AVEN_11183-1 [Araneus ventricosus]